MSAAVRRLVNPIVERYGVHLVLAGHEHAYERTVPLSAHEQQPEGSGTVYVTTGGGGAGLHNVGIQPETAISQSVHHYLRIDVEGSSMTVRAIGLQGQEIDRFTLRPAPMILAGGVVNVGDFTSSVAAGGLVAIFGRNLALREAANS